MKLNISNSSVTDLPNSGEWLFIQSALGDIDVTFVHDSKSRTITIGQGEMIEMPYTGLQFQARGSTQEIQFRIGWGKYTPNITAVTSTIIDQIKKPIEISGVNSELNVKSIADSVTVKEISEAVEVSKINDAVTVKEISEAVEVSKINDAVTVKEISEAVEVSKITENVKTVEQIRESFVSTDYPVLANSFIDVPARDRSQIMFQNMGENETRCRVSDADALAASGLWLIGGGSLFGESPILRTKSAFRIWNTSDVESMITVNEVF
ncbi:hypothetical protein [Marinomonas sp. 2405UD68-3]|uniref:hypothetical protein n=1 Tax=Marinomonas sp. 2405UD68-3 TaxID=3391835 RepID=UPI0039C8EC79